VKMTICIQLLYSIVLANASPSSCGTKMPGRGIVRRRFIYYATLTLAAATDVAAIEISQT
jgi:hypothetical protein